MNMNNTQDMSAHWIQVAADDKKRINELEAKYGLDFKTAGNSVWETDAFIYLPVLVERRDGDTVSCQQLIFALSDNLLVTVQPSVPFDLFDKAIVRMRRLPSLGNGPHAIMCSLLWSLNESCDSVVNFMSDVLDNMAEDIHEAKFGQRKSSGHFISDIETKKVSLGMNECQKALARVQDSQLSMISAARHLQGEVVGNAEINAQVGMILSDLKVVEGHAGFEQRKIRFLQRSLRTTLDQKQNAVIKVFSIITAVFLPPSLIATVYSMNFTHMPELMREHGVLINVVLTFLVGMLPFIYIIRSGWAR